MFHLLFKCARTGKLRRGGKTTGRRWSDSETPVPVTRTYHPKRKLRRSDGLQAGGGAIAKPL
ncbi:hypothetical protein [Prevotella koreensis]